MTERPGNQEPYIRAKLPEGRVWLYPAGTQLLGYVGKDREQVVFERNENFGGWKRSERKV